MEVDILKGELKTRLKYLKLYLNVKIAKKEILYNAEIFSGINYLFSI